MTRGERAGAVGADRGRRRRCRPTTPARRSGCRRRADDHLRVRARRCSRRRRPDRFGLADRRPAALRELPHFPGDDARRRPRRGGDLCVQACADDPQVAVHAIRNLARIGFGTRRGALVAARLRPHVDHLDGAVDAAQPVRLQGRHRQRQGRGDRRRSTSTSGSAGGRRRRADWLAGGSYLVARRIRMTIEAWDRQPLGEQEGFVGRDQGHRRPAVRRRRSSPSPTSRCPAATGPVDPRRRARPASRTPTTNDGVRMLRRGYNFVDGTDALGRLDAGLFFLAFVRDPRTAVHPDAEQDGPARRADGVPAVHVVGDLRGPSGCGPRGARRPGAVRLRRRTPDRDSSASLSGRNPVRPQTNRGRPATRRPVRRSASWGRRRTSPRSRRGRSCRAGRRPPSTGSCRCGSGHGSR